MDREFDALLHPALAAAIKEAGYGFDGIPAAWAAVMSRCRPEMLAEVTAPVLIVNGQLDQLRVGARRYAAAARSAPWVRVVTVPRGLHVVPLDPPARGRGRAVGAHPGGATVTEPPTPMTCACASPSSARAAVSRSPGATVHDSRPRGHPEGCSVP